MKCAWFICAWFFTRNRCQYVGQTADKFRDRWNNYKNNVRRFGKGEHCMQRQLYDYSHLLVHSAILNDVSVMLIDKADHKDHAKRENYWIGTLNSRI